jgi:MFS family permease
LENLQDTPSHSFLAMSVTTSPPISLVERPQYSPVQKWLLIVVFCLAEYLDAFNNSALFPTTPTIARDLSIAPNEVTWLFAAYTSTFAAFLLIVRLLLSLIKGRSF